MAKSENAKSEKCEIFKSEEELKSYCLYYLDQSGDSKKYEDFGKNVCTMKEQDNKFIILDWFVKDVSKPSIKELREYDKSIVEDFYCLNYLLPSLIIMGNQYISLPQSTIEKLPKDWLSSKMVFNETSKQYQLL